MALGRTDGILRREDFHNPPMRITMAPTTTIDISIDHNLQFTVYGARIGEKDPINLVAEAGFEVTLQILAPMSFTANHSDKGTVTTWAPVTTTLAAFAAQHTFPCPRSPFTLTVTATGTAGGTTKPATKKVRIEAGAAGGTKKPGFQAPGQQNR